jgi:hypothetical protein
MEMKKALGLGKAPVKSGVAKTITPRTIEDRLTAIENMIASLAEINHKNMATITKQDEQLNAYEGIPRNKDGVPLHISLIGSTQFGPRILYVGDDGYYLGNEKYASLSAAAEATSGITRKSGWVFWKLPDGRTIKEAFKKPR